MVILFSGRKEREEKEIIEILTGFSASYISDKKISAENGGFTVISEYKCIELDLNSGIAVILDSGERFKNQVLPKGIIGICDSDNTTALEIFKLNKTPVITCGMNNKSTVTLSSLNNGSALLSVQRTINCEHFCKIEPGEYKIEISGNYSPFSVMSSAVILMLKG